jgi:hypothetical protein
MKTKLFTLLCAAGLLVGCQDRSGYGTDSTSPTGANDTRGQGTQRQGSQQNQGTQNQGTQGTQPGTTNTNQQQTPNPTPNQSSPQ